jgi:hypothetical protein
MMWLWVVAVLLILGWAIYRLRGRGDSGRGPEAQDGRKGSRGAYWSAGG